MALTDATGLPLAVCETNASPYEVTLVEAALAASFLRERPERLIADRAYDSGPLDAGLAEKGIELTAPHRRNRKRLMARQVRRLLSHSRLRVQQDLRTYTQGGGGFARSEFASELGKGGPIAMAFGPHGSSQALYYTTYANGGEVHRVTYVQGANRAPHAAVSASPSSGDVPLEVSFDGSDSNDPDFGDAMTSYLWNFGDGSPAVETTTSAAKHTYTEA